MEPQIKYDYEPHTFRKIYRSIPYEVCVKCGLVALRNDFTKWCIDKGCNNMLHPGYAQARRRFTSSN